MTIDQMIEALLGSGGIEILIHPSSESLRDSKDLREIDDVVSGYSLDEQAWYPDDIEAVGLEKYNVDPRNLKVAVLIGCHD